MQTNRKPQVVSFVAQTTKNQKSQFPGVQDAYLKHIMTQLEQEVTCGINQTFGANAQREVSLLFRFDSPEVRRVVTITEKSLIQMNQPRKSSPKEDLEDDRPGDLEATTQTIQDWIVRVMQRVVQEKASSIELILVFKRRQLVGRRETLNAQAPV